MHATVSGNSLGVRTESSQMIRTLMRHSGKALDCWDFPRCLPRMNNLQFYSPPVNLGPARTSCFDGMNLDRVAAVDKFNWWC